MSSFPAAPETSLPRPTPLSLNEVRKVLAKALRPEHFFVAPGAALVLEPRPDVTLPWEIFHGRLLPPTQTRRRQTFEAWDLFWVEAVTGPATEPFLSLLLDVPARQVHVTRSLECYVWEGYDAGDNVIQSREVRRWVRELVATLALDQFGDPEELRDELACRLFQAVAGASRLPLTSVESPLPAYSFGRLAYVPRSLPAPDAGPLTTIADLIAHGLHGGQSERQTTKLLETVLRAAAPDELPTAAGHFRERWLRLGRSERELPALLRDLFNETALSPNAERFIANALSFAGLALPLEEHIDFLGSLLRTLVRHLTAYDLLTFHHRGANYPDALLLDAALKDYLSLIERHPDAFFPDYDDAEPLSRRKRLRRRALRQGYPLRCRHEGYLVPDEPTSPGENARLLPPHFPVAPSAQTIHRFHHDNRARMVEITSETFARDMVVRWPSRQCE